MFGQPFDIVTECRSLVPLMNHSCDDLKNIHNREHRSIPREVLIPSGTDDLWIQDQLEKLMERRMILRNGIRVILSLEKWRWNHPYIIERVLVPHLVSVSSTSVVYDVPNSQWSDVNMELRNEDTKEIEMIKISQEELNHILAEPSIEHNDGQICKQLKNGDVIEFHGLLTTSVSSSLDDQIINGYDLTYHPRTGPIWIGHRGCGMNTVLITLLYYS